MLAPIAPMTSRKSAVSQNAPAANTVQKQLPRQTRASLRSQQQEPASSPLPVDSSTSTPVSGGELVVLDRENDQPQTLTPSTQQILLDRANTGDLQARLELVSPDIVETELAQIHRREQPNQTVLDFLRHPGDGVTPAQAAAQVLNELADETEETAQKTVFVWRYIQLNEVWKTHEDPKIRSLKAFINSLDQEDIVLANAVIGTTTQNNKRQSILAIQRIWGLDWFDSIPKDLLPANVTAPIHLSKRLLFQIATTCKKAVSLLDAVEQWKQSVQARLGGQIRRTSSDSRISQKQHIIPDDISRLYQVPTSTTPIVQRASYKSVAEIKQDRIQLKAPVRLMTLAPKPDSKRKHSSTDAEQDGDRPQKRLLSKDGTKEMVRIRNHLIVQPVPAADSEDGASQTASQAESIPPSAQRNLGKSIFVTDTDSEEEEEEEEVVDDVDEIDGGSHSRSCAGSLILGRLADHIKWSQDGYECCDKCRAAVASVQYAIDRAVAKIAAAHR